MEGSTAGEGGEYGNAQYFQLGGGGVAGCSNRLLRHGPTSLSGIFCLVEQALVVLPTRAVIRPLDVCQADLRGHGLAASLYAIRTASTEQWVPGNSICEAVHTIRRMSACSQELGLVLALGRTRLMDPPGCLEALVTA